MAVSANEQQPVKRAWDAVKAIKAATPLLVCSCTAICHVLSSEGKHAKHAVALQAVICQLWKQLHQCVK